MRCSNDFVGCIYSVAFRYYNNQTNQMDVKVRPFLILKAEKEDLPCDFSALPISKVTNKQNLSARFDVEIPNAKYGNLFLREPISYIRTHKIQTVHSTDFKNKICNDLRSIYPELSDQVRELVKEYVDDIF